MRADLRRLETFEPRALCGVAAAVTAAAVVGAGATVYGASKSAAASKEAGQLSYQATQDATAEQRRQFDYIQQQNAPFRQVGLSAANALGSSFGLPGYGNGGAMTGGSAADPYYGYAVSQAARGVASTPMTAPQSAAYGDRAIEVPAGSLGNAKTGNAGTSPAVSDTGAGVMTAATPAAAQQAQVPDWEAFAAANPDVAQWAASGHGDPNIPIDQQSIEQRYAYWLQNGVKVGDTRASQPLPMKTVAAPTTGTQAPAGAAAGYSDPSAPNGYAMTSPEPGAYVAPTRQAYAPLDVSLGAYQKSPGYDFQTSEAQRAIGNVASSNGGVYSGARLKAAGDRAVQMANTDYSGWRDYATGQYNQDRNRTDTLYNDQRAFDYGQNQDAVGRYDTNRGYLTSRLDTRNNQLMSLAGLGTGATASNASAAQNFANNSGNLAMTGAQARGNAATNAANAWSAGANSIAQGGLYLAGRYMGSSTPSTGLTSYLQGAAAANPNLF